MHCSFGHGLSLTLTLPPLPRWLKHKRAEKRAEQQAARQLSRRLVVEERRARRMQDLLCSVNEAKPFRFTEHLSYHF